MARSALREIILSNGQETGQLDHSVRRQCPTVSSSSSLRQALATLGSPIVAYFRGITPAESIDYLYSFMESEEGHKTLT